MVAGAIDNTAAAVGAGAGGGLRRAPLHWHLFVDHRARAVQKDGYLLQPGIDPLCVPGRYLLTALQATAGGNLTYLRDNIIYHKDELLQEADVPDIFKVLDQIAERVPAGANGVLYTPWIWGERAPVDDRSLRAGLYNLSLNNTREDIIARSWKASPSTRAGCWRRWKNSWGAKCPASTSSVGGAQSDVWCQIFADVMNLEIKQVADPCVRQRARCGLDRRGRAG